MDYKLACEYRDVAFRREHVAASGKTRSEIEAVLEAVETIAEPVDIVNRFRPLSQDVNDDMVLDVAINGSADAILTHNTKHFREAARRFHLLVQTPAELLVRLKERRS